ncbi:presenilin-associated rhomboid-like protein, mitochondrial [Montipora capricornis]|uniref:presenilin-associated rhomboid-like protein, mitochondrial n=1 Tax=Montipora capricornis TaxID=246305 RepID=UPI0035F1422C
MAFVFAISRKITVNFCRSKSLPSLYLPRPRGLNGRGRIQHRKAREKKDLGPGEPEEGSKWRVLVRPFGFTMMTGAISFGGCAIFQYERARLSYIQGHNSLFPSTASPKQFDIRNMLNKWWNSLSGGSKTALVIIFLNTTVFFLWQIPSMQLVMIKWFTMSATSGPSIRLLTSAFSHMDFWHLAVNMFVLWSFAPPIEALLGKEQFIAFYITGGVFASFASTAYRVAMSNFLGVSLGASGALLSVLALVCIHHPDARLSLVFLPFFTFSASTGLLSIVGLDLAGLIMRWQFFDHAAHLGGVLFGAWYLKFGHLYLWDKRWWLVNQWHKLRTGSKKT